MSRSVEKSSGQNRADQVRIGLYCLKVQKEALLIFGLYAASGFGIHMNGNWNNRNASMERGCSKESS